MVPALQQGLERWRRQPAQSRTDSRPTTSGKRYSRRQGLTDILENYAQIVEENESEDRQEEAQTDLPALPPARRGAASCWRMWRAHGAGKRYLIQHSAGSGKSNSIAWLAHQLIGLQTNGKAVFDSIIVVTDRRILDQQIRDTIKQFAAGGRDRGSRRALGRPAQVHRGRQEDHHLDGAEVSVHPRRDRRRASRPKNSPSSSTRHTPARAGRPRQR